MTPLRLPAAVVLALAVGPGCDPAAPTAGTGDAAAHATPPPFSADRTIDLAAVQGDWEVARVETPPGPGVPDELFGDAVGTITGDRLVVRSRRPGGEEKVTRAALFPDPAQTPKQVDIVPLNAQGRPTPAPGRPPDGGYERYRGIYAIDGDRISVAAAAAAGGRRPTGFEPAPGVIVVRLRKKSK